MVSAAATSRSKLCPLRTFTFAAQTRLLLTELASLLVYVGLKGVVGNAALAGALLSVFEETAS